MIPATTGFLDTDFEVKAQPSKTYEMELSGERIRGYTDGIGAVKQAIYKILNTERYKYPIYSWNYGVELDGLFGEPVTWVCPELERRITEALVWDDRVTSVSDFNFDLSLKGAVAVSFTAHTIYGDVEGERTVNF